MLVTGLVMLVAFALVMLAAGAVCELTSVGETVDRALAGDETADCEVSECFGDVDVDWLWPGDWS